MKRIFSIAILLGILLMGFESQAQHRKDYGRHKIEHRHKGPQKKFHKKHHVKYKYAHYHGHHDHKPYRHHKKYDRRHKVLYHAPMHKPVKKYYRR